MITATSLGHVMQQRRHKQGPPRFNFRHHLGGYRRCLCQFARFDIMQDTDHLDRVLINGIAVIHVELHHCYNPPEIVHVTAQHTTFIHQPQNAFRISLRRQDIDEFI